MATYRKGYLVELRARDRLFDMGASLVMRSAGSRSPADLLAIFPGKREIWLVQVKSEEAPRTEEALRRRFQALAELRGAYTCRSVVFMRRNGRYEFIEV
jgi:hypothetical protein